MKSVLFMTMLALSVAVHAEKLYPARLVFTDGKILNGLASMPEEAADSKLAYKATEKDDKVHYKSDLLKTVVYYFGKDSVVFDRLKTYSFNGKKMTDLLWLQVLKRGYVTLFYSLKEGQFLSSTGSMPTEDHYWLCLRPGEEAATIVSWKVGSINANMTFKKKGPKYFADYPELVQKIESKEYKWDNIMQVVNEYNEWKKKKKGK